MLKLDYLKYSSGNSFIDGSSIAATWIWAPALLLSYQLAFQYGCIGLLYFLIPNILTVFIFGLFASKLRKTMNGLTIGNIVKVKSNKSQYKLNITATTLLLILSSTVQLIGISIGIQSLLKVPTLYITIPVSIFILAYTWNHGFKIIVITDCIKYIVLTLCAITLLSYFIINNEFTLTTSHNFNFIDISTMFGLSIAINLLFALYPDQTFWQRAFSIEQNNIIKSFTTGALLFGIIPFIFGMLGLLANANGYNTNNLSNLFTNDFCNILLMITILLALVATLDSNISAMNSLIYNEFDLKNNSLLMIRLSSILLLTIANLIVYLDISLLNLFLIYGTIRLSVAPSVILMILDKFNKRKLVIITFLNLFILCPGFIILKLDNNPNCWIITCCILLNYIYAYSNNKKENIHVS